MSRIRANFITNRLANGAPTVSNGLVVSGVTTTTNLDITGNVSIGGTLTYEDVTNIDSVGIITAQSGIHIDDSISHIGDTDTKIRFPLGDTITAQTGGNERVRIDSSGRVLIGTTVEGEVNADDLTIATTGNTGITIRSGNTHNGVIQFSDGTSGTNEYAGFIDYDHNTNVLKFGTASTERLRVDSSGRVLIGTTTEGHENGDDLTIATSGTTGITIRSGTSGGGNIYFSDATSGTAEYAGWVSYSHVNNSLLIGTNSTEKLRIMSNGYMGLGISNPSRRIHVHTSGSGSDYMQFTNDTTGTTDGDGYVFGINGNEDVIHNNLEATNTIFFTSGAERFRIDSSGKLGVNVTSPSAQLHVENDNANASTYYLNTDATVLIQNKNSNATAKTVLKLEGPVGGGDCALVYGASATNLIISDRQNERLRINSSGTITTPYQFHIEVQRSGNQTGYDARSSAGGTPVVFNDVVRTRGTSNSALNTSTGKITVPVDGVYFLEASVYTTSGNALRQGWFTEGSSRMQYSDITEDENTDQVQAHGMHYLSANTEVGFHAYGATASSITIGANTYHTWFRVTLIG